MIFEQSHRRFNPLTSEWILVSPHRTQRPWQGKTEQNSHQQIPSYKPDCYLCPKNERANGNRNPDYSSTFVFDNDFSALKNDSELLDINETQTEIHFIIKKA